MNSYLALTACWDRPAVNVVGAKLYRMLTAVGVCPKVRHFDLSADQAIKIAIPGSTESDAERRRYLILVIASNHTHLLLG